MCLFFQQNLKVESDIWELSAKFGLYFGLFWYFGPSWGQVPNVGPNRSACIHFDKSRSKPESASGFAADAPRQT